MEVGLGNHGEVAVPATSTLPGPFKASGMTPKMAAGPVGSKSNSESLAILVDHVALRFW